MYVVTFYSFKGGVGRTMSLVNVAVELAAAGRRVLIVDFDLEASGLETFNLPSPRGTTLGVVDYVATYVRDRQAPDAGDFLYEAAGVGSDGGRLWVMPAGRGDVSYAATLSGIDWPRLYSEQGGYLMMEDLKAQWKALLDPDYVLVDSRTGHSDIAGICTRQLPDAVVALFFPNDQNLIGLNRVVQDIRAESGTPRTRAIQLHFVASDIPAIDDEDSVLEQRLQKFSEVLQYQALAATIHHYDTLAMVDQQIFTRSRRKTKLAAEYRALAEVIVRGNPHDREGVLKLLEEMLVHPRQPNRDAPASAAETGKRLEEIALAHPQDGAILFTLGHVFEGQGRYEEALSAYERAQAAGFRTPEALLRSAHLYMIRQAPTQAIDQLSNVLKLPVVTAAEITQAVEQLRDLAPDALAELASSRAIASLPLDSRVTLAFRLLTTRSLVSVAEAVLRGVSEAPTATAAEKAGAHVNLMFALVGAGRFEEAMRVRWASRPNPANVDDLSGIFNYAMAEWGLRGEPGRDLFERIVVLGELRAADRRFARDPNNVQCIGLAYAVLGEGKKALAWLDSAELLATGGPVLRPIFSAWRYLLVSPAEFRRDLEAIRRMASGKRETPAFIEDARGAG